MHKFQPYPLDLLEVNPFLKLSKEWALVTAGDKTKNNLMTVSWGAFGEIWGKHAVTIYIRESRFTKEFIDKGEFFSLSFLSEDYKNALNVCGSKSGRDTDKWKEAGLTVNTHLGIPFPDEANLLILCKKMAAVPMPFDSFTDKSIEKKWYKDGDAHVMYIGEILEILAR